MPRQNVWSAADAFGRYEEIRARLPETDFPKVTKECAGLLEIADQVDAFLLDSFGVLNVGQSPIPGAVNCVLQLRAMGKRIIVLTNAASYPLGAALDRYRRLGFDFTPEEVVSSRDVCTRRLGELLPSGRWGAIASRGDRFEDIAVDVVHWTAERPEQVDGFVFLSSSDIDNATLSALEAALRTQPRPLVIANPDLVAPRESGLSKEPGYFGHMLADRLDISPVFFGKPYEDAFTDAMSRLPGIPASRIAMVGDTLHTDILGGRFAGAKTVLVTDFGLFRGLSSAIFVKRSGIVPDFTCARI